MAAGARRPRKGLRADRGTGRKAAEESEKRNA